jgi:hypothetical protein
VLCCALNAKKRQGQLDPLNVGYNRACIELSHLEVVSHQENIIRTERYEILRELRLHVLLAMYPQIEFFPITLT